MKALNNLKTSVKLIGSFLIVSLLSVLIAFLGYTNMKTINDGMTTMYLDNLVPVSDMGAIDADMNQIRGDVYKGLYLATEMDKSKTSIAALSKILMKELQNIKLLTTVMRSLQSWQC